MSKIIGIQNTHTECDILINKIIKEYSNVKGYELNEGLISLQKGDIDVFCSTGNTKTVITTAVRNGLKSNDWRNLSIAVKLPNGKFLTDVGANPNFNDKYDYKNCLEQLLLELYPVKDKIGLLNIGSERDKGGLLRTQTYNYLELVYKERFIGNVEGNELNTTQADIILTDGFTGNIVLKMMEEYGGWNWEDVGGAYLLGLTKPVIIGHGRSTEKSIRSMINKAL